MRILHTASAQAERTYEASEERPHDSTAAPFRLSPPEPAPNSHPEVAIPHRHREPRHSSVDHDTEFELIVDKDDLLAATSASPAELQGIRELEEFQRDPGGYKLVGEGGGLFSLFGRRGDRPASWLFVKWRAGVTAILKFLRFIDDWAYLVSVPFLVLMLFAIVSSSRGLIHAGAVVVVLVNYGRFWADLLALYVRPFKDGPLQGLAFLFPPYAIYYIFAHWDRMKPILRRMLTSCIPIVLVLMAYSFLPSVNPAVKDVPGISAKLEQGEEEIDREIRSDLKQLESEFSGAVEKKVGPSAGKR